MNVTDEIKSRLDIVDVISEYVSLRKSGRSYTGFCPFHHNTRTPAFTVFPETQTWYCFGACAEGGDVFSFMMKQEGWDFKEALQQLAKRAGVTLEEQTPADKARRAEERKLSDLLTAAAGYFHQLFRHAPQAEIARDYVADRGLTPETQEAFQIGFALDSWDACRTHFNGQGYDDQELIDAGLLTENEERGTRYDRFRNRLMIPIRDGNGRVVGFGARTLEKDGIPKYLNSPQTELFDKSRLLYGLDMAKRQIREARQVVIVEGYMDVMQGWQAGFRNIVAQMGTALTESQLRQLKRYTKRFVLALDADAAGVQATMRGLQVAREALDREVEVKFDAYGLVQHEGRLKADIRIVTLPPGKDPDNIIQEDPGQWPRLLERAKPVVAYVIGVMTTDLDLSDAKAKTEVARQVIPLIKDIVDPVERDHYWQELARALQVDERSLRQVQVTEKRTRQAAPAPAAKTSAAKMVGGNVGSTNKRHKLFPKAAGTAMRERYFLSQCLNHPRLLWQVNQLLEQQGETAVVVSDFSAPEDRALYKEMSHYLGSGTVAAIDELCDSLDDTLLLRVESLLELAPSNDSEPDRLIEKLTISVLDWRLSKIQERNIELRQLFHDKALRDDPGQVQLYKQQIRDGHRAIQRLNKAKDSLSVMSRGQVEKAAYGR